MGIIEVMTEIEEMIEVMIETEEMTEAMIVEMIGIGEMTGIVVTIEDMMVVVDKINGTDTTMPDHRRKNLELLSLPQLKSTRNLSQWMLLEQTSLPFSKKKGLVVEVG